MAGILAGRMARMKRIACTLAFALTASATVPFAQEAVDSDIVWKIRREATDRSQIMRTLHFLTDRYGPRLTGSPNLRNAQDWLVKETTTWGLKNAHLESWSFGHPGWLNEKLSVHVVSPVTDALVVEALAWTPGTNGPVTAPAVLLDLPPHPTKETLQAFLDANRNEVKGKVVLIGPAQTVRVTILPPNKRRDDNDVRAQFGADAAAASAGGPPAAPATPAGTLTANQIAEQVDGFLVQAGAVARVNDAGREHGQIRAFNNRTFDMTKAVPTVV